VDDPAIIEPAQALSRWSVRMRPHDCAAWEGILGLSLPIKPLRSHSSEAGSALWLGPDEWLVLMPAQSARAFRDRYSRATTAPPASFVDISQRNAGFTLRGAHIRWILNSGCPLDLSEIAFPPGACTRTLYHKAEIVLWRGDDVPSRSGGAVWHLECWRSFAPYVEASLARAAAECAAEKV
jgi:sarcosine oxidase subunit gamma